MNAPSNPYEEPPQLQDALARIEDAKNGYISLADELNKFLYNYVKGMVKEWDPSLEGFVVQLRHPSESFIRGRPAVLVAQIVENLRTALDYMIFQLSVMNNPDLNEREPQFVIADSKSKFEQQAKTRLRQLTSEQKNFIEQIQPYQGNGSLALLGEIANQSKHRYLRSMLDVTDLELCLAEITRQDDFRDWFMFSMGKGHATFARFKDRPIFLLDNKYDTMVELQHMIQHVETIIRVSYCFFQGRPLRLTVLKSKLGSV